MPFSKNPDNYPDEYKLIWRRALTSDEPLVLSCEDERSAQSLRHRLNSFRRAYVDSKREGWSSYTKFAISLEGNRLIFRDQSKELEGVLDQIGLSKDDIQKEQIEDYDKQLDEAFDKLTENGNEPPASEESP